MVQPILSHTEKIMADLDPRIIRAARYWAYRTGEDADELAGEMRLQILEKAARQADFLSQTPAYIVSGGAWAALNKLRGWRRQVPLDDAHDSLPDRAGGERVLEEVFGGVDEEGKALIRAIKQHRDKVLKKNGTLNISKLAECMGGVSSRTLYRKIDGLRSQLSLSLAV